MNLRIAAIRHRRALLIARAALQRTQVAQALQPWQQSLTVVDAAARVARAVRRRPVFAAVGTSLVVLAARQRWLGWAGRLFTLWEMARLARMQWHKR